MSREEYPPSTEKLDIIVKRADNLLVADIEYVDKVTERAERELAFKESCMANVDIPCGPSHDILELREQIRHLYKAMGKEYLTPIEKLRRIAKKIDRRKDIQLEK